MSTVPDAGSVLLPGPWEHHDYAVNGVRLHVAEAGRGPLVVLLHGFPEFWWAWRHQIPVLAAAGFRVLAPDLRGYGASDKPPRGYDAVTAAADVAGLVRAVGEREAMVVGHAWGGLLAWSTAALHPGVVRRLAVLSMPHPLRLRAAIAGHPRQLRAVRPWLGYQLPRWPERRLTRHGGRQVERLLTAWSGARWRTTDDFATAVHRYRAAMTIPQAAYGSMEYVRWAFRAVPRSDGRRWARALALPVTAPTVHLHGADDPLLLPASVEGSGRSVAAAYEFTALPGVGHFPAEEAPAEVTETLLRWAHTQA